MKTVKLTRPDPIEFTLPDGRAFIVQPCTRAQMRAALELDPAPGEVRGPAEAAEQRARQLAALVGGQVEIMEVGYGAGLAVWKMEESGPILAGLSADEEMQVLGALMAQGHGQDPAAALALHDLAKKKAVLDVLSASRDLTATPSNSPSTSGDRSPRPSSSDSSIA